MALTVGSTAADAGMSKAIYDAINKQLAPPFQDAVNNASGDAKAKAQEALDAAQDGWKKLAYAIAQGVIGHITANMEIYNITTQGNIPGSMKGKTGAAEPAAHQHTVDLSTIANNVVFAQNNDGTGHVR